MQGVGGATAGGYRGGPYKKNGGIKKYSVQGVGGQRRGGIGGG